MLNHFRNTALLILATTLLFGCATPTQPSADIPAYAPHPSPIYNFQVVTEDGNYGVYRSGQPKGDADWDYLEKIGIKTVVKLNQYSTDEDATEELQEAEKHHIKVIRIYMPPEDFPHNWNLWASPDLKDLMHATEELENRNNGKILVHCSHGKDRTGLVVAIYSVRNKNLCKDAAYEQMKHYGTNTWLQGLKPMLYSPGIKESPNCSHTYK